MGFQDSTEPIERTLWSIPFTSTSKQARELYAAILNTEEWIRWSTISDQIQHGDFASNDPDGLCKQHTQAYRTMSRLVIRKLAEMEIDQ